MSNKPNAQAANGVVVCSRCGAYIGHMVERSANGSGWQIWLAVGGAVVYAAHGVCMACGEEWHWSSSEQRLAALLRRRRRSVTP